MTLTPSLQVRRVAAVRKIRELPVRGEVLVEVGQPVDADAVVAKAELPGDLYILRIPEQLGIEPHEVMHGLKVRSGEVVSANQLLCEHAGLFGLFRSRFFSPAAGIVEFIAERTGHIGVRAAPRPIEIKAYVAGTVVAIDNGKSATIETRGVFIQGIFGIGGERIGVVTPLPVPPSKVLLADDIPSDCTGKILIGGSSPSYAALKLAQDRGAVGFITGSIDDKALAQFLGFDIGIALTGDEPISMSVIVTEGFGQLALSSRIVELATEFAGHRGAINGATQVRAGALRPELLIAHTRQSSEVPSEKIAGELVIGGRIRLIRVPYFGKFAEITALPQEPTRIETGAVTRILKAKLESGVEITVPRANVELV